VLGHLCKIKTQTSAESLAQKMFNDHLTIRAWGLCSYAATALFFPIPFGSVKGAKIIFGMLDYSVSAFLLFFFPQLNTVKIKQFVFPLLH